MPPVTKVTRRAMTGPGSPAELGTPARRFTAGLGFLVERWAGAPPADDPSPVIARLVTFLTGGMEQVAAGPGAEG